MKQFTYTMRGAFPLQFGTANHLGEIASCYPDTIGKVTMGNREADLAKPFQLMTMGVRKGDAVTISVEGPSEVELFDVLCDYFYTPSYAEAG